MTPVRQGTPAGLDLGSVRQRLPGRSIEWFDSVGSTMTVAEELADGGCPHGTIVGAEEQTAGVGRLGRRWHSAAGEGLYISFVLRTSALGTEARPDALPVMMLALGLAAREAVVRTSGLAADLRWPNDVLLNGKKCAGVLAHAAPGAVIAGVGINVAQAALPGDLETPATSLEMEGAQVAREDLLVSLAGAVDQYCAVLSRQGTKAILSRFAGASSYVLGRRVTAEAEGRRIEGVTRGLDASGFLRVREDSGTVVTVIAGGVRLV